MTKRNRIYCDYDFRRTPRLAGLFAIFHTLKIGVNWMRDDRTRRGWHRIIDTDFDFTEAEAVALELLAGSDYRRGRINLMRAISLRMNPDKFWYQRSNILFSEKLP